MLGFPPPAQHPCSAAHQYVEKQSMKGKPRIIRAGSAAASCAVNRICISGGGINNCSLLYVLFEKIKIGGSVCVNCVSVLV